MTEMTNNTNKIVDALSATYEEYLDDQDAFGVSGILVQENDDDDTPVTFSIVDIKEEEETTQTTNSYLENLFGRGIHNAKLEMERLKMQELDRKDYPRDHLDPPMKENKIGGLTVNTADFDEIGDTAGQMVLEIIDDMFEYHKWNAEQTEQGAAVREALASAAKIILINVPPSADRSTAIRKLRECRMDANSAITHGGKY